MPLYSVTYSNIHTSSFHHFTLVAQKNRVSLPRSKYWHSQVSNAMFHCPILETKEIFISFFQPRQSSRNLMDMIPQQRYISTFKSKTKNFTYYMFLLALFVFVGIYYHHHVVKGDLKQQQFDNKEGVICVSHWQ